MSRSKYAKRLTPEQAEAVKEAREIMTYDEIMETFDISRQAVANIVKGRTHREAA
jgi:predicted DNA-binding protein YlxM (UPF0122 family)